MKKYFVLALVVMAFVVAPVMADVALSGEYVYGGSYDLDAKNYNGETNKMELDAMAALDDYNTFKFELEEDASVDTPLDSALTLNYIKVATDWGKYFGFAESGFGLVSTVGMNNWGYTETVDFTGYELEYSDTAYLTKDNGMMLNFDVMSMVKPYFAMQFDTMGDGAKYLLGTTVDVEPVFFEAYYMADGKKGAEAEGLFGVEALYSGEVSDGVVLTSGGYFAMQRNDADDWDKGYGFGIGAEAYGATVNVSLKGTMLAEKNAAGYEGGLEQVGVDAKYGILEWLSVNGAFLLNTNEDYNKESFSGAEFGFCVMPGAVAYKLGYLIENEDAANYSSVMSKTTTGTKGGMYFVVDLDY